LNWRGILIEPNKQIFQELKKNRSSKNIFENVALVSESFSKKIYLTNDNLESKITGNLNNSNIEVFTSTLNNILKKNEIYKINLFSLDVEGYEENVLNGIDLKIFEIDYILIETNNFEKINSVLKYNNYNFLEKLSFHDYLFKRI
jgi:FkbM family methyltransferase